MEPMFQSRDSFIAVNGNRMSTIQSREEENREKQGLNSIFEKRILQSKKFMLLSATYNVQRRENPLVQEKKNDGNPSKQQAKSAKEIYSRKATSIQKQKNFHILNSKRGKWPTANSSSSSSLGTALYDRSSLMRSSGRSETKHLARAALSAKLPAEPMAKLSSTYQPQTVCEASVIADHQNAVHKAFLDSLFSAEETAEHKHFKRIQNKSFITSGKEVPQEHWLDESLSSESVFSSSEASSYSLSDSWIDQEHSLKNRCVRHNGDQQQGSLMEYARRSRKGTVMKGEWKQCQVANKVQIDVEYGDCRKTENVNFGTNTTFTSLSGPMQQHHLASKQTGQQEKTPSLKKISNRHKTAVNLPIKEVESDHRPNRSVSDLHLNGCILKTPPSMPVMPHVGINFIDYVEEIPKQSLKERASELSPPTPDAFLPHNRHHEYNGGSYSADLSWLSMVRSDSDEFFSPCKTNDRDCGDKHHTTQTKLRSVIRNLEAAFMASKSAALAKTHSQNHGEEMSSSQSLDFLDEESLLSPLKSLHEHAVLLKSSHGPPVDLDMPEFGRSRVHVDSHSMEYHVQNDKALFSGITRQRNSGMEFSCQQVQSTSRSMHSKERMLQGYLQCIVRDGFPCYTLTMNDSEDVLLAKAHASERNDSRKDGCRWIYTFHADRSNSRGKVANVWRNWVKRDDKYLTSLLSGEMEVTSKIQSEISYTGEKVHSIISEFVLFDGRRELDVAHSRSSRFLSSTDACPTRTESSLPRSVLSHSQGHLSIEIPWSSSTTNINPKAINLNQPQPHTTWKKDSTGHRRSFSFDMYRDVDLIEPELNLLRPCPASSELAAVVIQTPIDDDRNPKHLMFSSQENMWNNNPHARDRKNQNESFGCLQLPSHSKTEKTLEYGVPQHLTAMVPSSSNPCRRKYRAGIIIEQHSESKDPNPITSSVPETSQRITVMLPVEHHGLPNDRNQAPTSLIDRWKSGGKCDCGGWDLGCGMRILGNKGSCQPSATLNRNTNSQKMPINIYSQGRSQELVLSMIFVQDGFFFLNFHPQLSPLKAFAVSVASLHNKSIYIKRNEMLYGRSCRYT